MFLLILLFLSNIHGLESVNNYDSICEQIIKAAKACAQAHNQNDHEAAEIAQSKVLSTFAQAIAIEPKEPQAYMHMATFYTNSHQFDESVQMWQTVLPLLPSTRQDLIQMVQNSIKQANYGKLSTTRDAIYSHGEGDINAAVDMIQKQLEIYYSPRILFDLATLQTMQSNIDPNKFEDATVHFGRAQEAAISAAATFQSMMATQRRRRPGKKACPTKTKLHQVGTKSAAKMEKLGFTRTPLIMSETINLPNIYQEIYDTSVDTSLFLNQLTDATISGTDGLITKQFKCKLHVFLTSEGPVVPIHGNLWIAEDWKSNESFNIYDHSLERKYAPPNPTQKHQIVEEAVTLVGFSTTVYYHWMMNALPRLVALLPLLKEKVNMKLIVPQVDPSNHFISKTLAMTFEGSTFDIENRRIGYNTNEAPGVRLQVGTLLWVDWPIVTKKGKKATHCLTSPHGLVTTSNYLWKELDWEEADKTLLYIGRNGTSSRHLEDEVELLDRLKTITQEQGWLFKIFDNGASGMEKARETFSTANLIVGIHGSGLSNLLFCKKGTKIIEIGFESIAAEHYMHAAHALNLQYTKILIPSDVHAMGSREIQLGDDDLDEVIDAVVNSITTFVEL